jgi:tetratricopeptide (TPR) repeat protein
MIKKERIVSLILFSIVFAVYAISAPRTITFWDSSEFVTSSYNLQATHPPGSPFYTMLCSIILQFFAATKAAFISNLISGFFGALTVTFLFKITFYITTKIQANKSRFETTYLPYFTGITSALTLAFSNSFWVAATEAEVYTLSFALVTIMVYVMLKWEHAKTRKKESQLILLLALLLGIATSVHLITISIIIPLSLLFTYKKYGLSIKNIILSLFIGCIIFFGIYFFAIQGLIKLSKFIDIWLVNTFKLDVNTGILVVLFLICLFFTFSLWLTYKKQKITLHHIALAFVFYLIGFSSYVMPLQRASANTLIANSVSNSNRMLQYIKGDQFGIGNIPLLNGYTYNAPLDKDVPFTKGKPTLTFDANKQEYISVDNGDFKHVNYAKPFSMFFPRLFDAGNEGKYKSWTTIKGEPVIYPVKGENKTIYKPTYKENFSFFIDYQVSWLNLRYLYWNFIGKQNNNHGLGYIKDGNWVSGINSIDKSRVGDYSRIPDHYKNDKSRNNYYFIPFILGLLGLLSLLKHKQYFLTTLFLFLAFGLGITLYINPVPSSILVRERDYIFIGSFVIFSLWVGLSINLIYNALKVISSSKTVLIAIFILVFIGSPLQLLAKGWTSHQRSHDSFALEFAKAYLDACPQQAILITNGDNMTFPLWYLQDVEKYRTDIRVLNFDQMNLDTHIEKLKQKIGTSNPVDINLEKEFYRNGVDKLIPLNEEIKEPALLPVLFEFFKDSTTRINWNGKLKHYLPSTRFSIPIDTLKIKNKNLNAEELNASYTTEIEWSYPKKFYGLNEIVLLNVITNNIHNRPICFAINSKTGHYLGLQNYFVQNGMVEELAPILRKNSSINPKIVNTKTMYPFIMEKLQFNGLNDETSFLQYENRAYVQDILRRNYYFLAQALLEEDKTEQAIKVLDKSISLFPNKTIAYKQYAYALGKLYFRAGLPKKGSEICTIAMQNIWDELQWMTSFNPPHPTINVRHAETLKNIYIKMMEQFPGNKTTLKAFEQNYFNFEASYINWQKTNWPY